MSLLRRVERAQQALAATGSGELVPVMDPPPPPVLPPQPRTPAREALLNDIRHRLVGEVINAFDTLLDDKVTDVRTKIEGIVDRMISTNGFAVTHDERVRLVDEMADDVTGFGPLEPLLHDDTITEVMVNGPNHVYIERGGKIERVDSSFLNNEHVMRIIDRIITPMGRRIDEMSPRV
ncbi:MAG: pilus assembly protein CpaF, partial [Chloroflexota bacterium]|nr:pilus assembly protein CpaF [Chloroflexota bacterium]